MISRDLAVQVQPQPLDLVVVWTVRRQAFRNRKTPLSCGNSPGTHRQDNPKWTPGLRYTTDTYRCAIVRACDRAFPPPESLARGQGETLGQWRARLTAQQKAELATWRKAHRWHPHQLRHDGATELRKEFGLRQLELSSATAPWLSPRSMPRRMGDRSLRRSSRWDSRATKGWERGHSVAFPLGCGTIVP